MADEFDAYHKWLGIPPDEQPANHYRLLGVRLFESDPDVVANAADQRMAHVRTLQTGKHSTLSQKLLGEIATAKICLLNDDKRAAYDDALRTTTTAPKQTVSAKRTPAVLPAKALPIATAVDRAKRSQATLPTPTSAEMNFARDDSANRRSRSRGGKKNNHLALAGGAALVAVAVAFVVWRANSSQPSLALKPTEPAPPKSAPAPTSQPVAPSSESLPATETPSPSPQLQGDESSAVLQVEPTAETTEESSIGAEPATESAADPVTDTTVEPPEVAATQPTVTPAEDADPADKRLPLPSKEESGPALALVRDVYADDYQHAKKAADKLSLAERIFKAGVEEADPLQRYALLYEARSLGIAAGGAKVALNATELLSSQFEMNAAGAMLSTIEKLSDKDLPEEARAQLLKQINSLVDAGVENEDFDRATRLVAAATAIARKGRLVEQGKSLAKRAAQVAALSKQFKSANAARATLANDANNAAANAALGRYLCLAREDWDAGLPHLARGGDELSATAEQELKISVTTEEQVQLADAWWNIFEADKTLNKQAIGKHAAALYRAALPGITGLSKDRIEKRIHDVRQNDAEGSSRWSKYLLIKAEDMGDFVRVSAGGRISTLEPHSGPLEISFMARTDKNNIRVTAYGETEGVIWNWEVNSAELRVQLPRSGAVGAKVDPLKLNTWYKLRWVIGPHDVFVYTNNKQVFHKTGKFDLSRSGPVFLWTTHGSKLDVKNFVVKLPPLRLR